MSEGDERSDRPPGLDKLDALLQKTLTASNKDVQKKMATEKAARARARLRTKKRAKRK